MFLISLDPCEPNPCGAGAKCVSDKGNALCSCPVGKTGNPLVRCGKYLKNQYLKNQYYWIPRFSYKVKIRQIQPDLFPLQMKNSVEIFKLHPIDFRK